jgi:hypothetical protein
LINHELKKDKVSNKTQIEEKYLFVKKPINFKYINIATRMSWATGRQSTRLEDQAYSFVGIFDISIPIIYREGDNVFHRLQ